MGGCSGDSIHYNSNWCSFAPICRGLSVAKQQYEGGHKASSALSSPSQAQRRRTSKPDGLVGLDLGMPGGDSGFCEMRDPRSDFKMHGVIESELTIARVTSCHRAVVCSSKPLGCNLAPFTTGCRPWVRLIDAAWRALPRKSVVSQLTKKGPCLVV